MYVPLVCECDGMIRRTIFSLLTSSGFVRNPGERIDEGEFQARSSAVCVY
jgi:hypothetical protein